MGASCGGRPCLDRPRLPSQRLAAPPHRHAGRDSDRPSPGAAGVRVPHRRPPAVSAAHRRQVREHPVSPPVESSAWGNGCVVYRRAQRDSLGRAKLDHRVLLPPDAWRRRTAIGARRAFDAHARANAAAPKTAARPRHVIVVMPRLPHLSIRSSRSGTTLIASDHDARCDSAIAGLSTPAATGRWRTSSTMPSTKLRACSSKSGLRFGGGIFSPMTRSCGSPCFM
jgi:hypothetical protein